MTSEQFYKELNELTNFFYDKCGRPPKPDELAPLLELKFKVVNDPEVVA